jgi:hypothetical protein
MYSVRFQTYSMPEPDKAFDRSRWAQLKKQSEEVKND